MTRSPRLRENIVFRVTDLVGNTPLFHLGTAADGTRLLLKLEHLNPTGSATIRAATQLVAWAERTGVLSPGARIVEPDSGGGGLGLALVAVERGYRFSAVVDPDTSPDQLRALRAVGAELIYAGDRAAAGPQPLARRAVAAKLATEEKTWWPGQHTHPPDADGHPAVAHELLADLFGDVDYLVAPVGTGGGLGGTTRELRRLGSGVRAIGVEPAGSLFLGDDPGRYRNTADADRALIDDRVSVDDLDAVATARVLARHRGLLVGAAAGGAVHAALHRLDSLPARSTVVVLVPDAGEKYLATIFDDTWPRERGLLDPEAEHRVRARLDALTRATGLATEYVA